MGAEAASAGGRTRIPRQAYLLFVGLFLAVASNNLLTPLLPDIRDDMGVSLAAIGAFVSTYGLARLIVDLPSGALTTRIGPHPVAAVGVVLIVLSSAGAAVAPRFGLLIVARIVAGIGAGLVATVVLSALSDVAPPDIRGRVMSLYQVANNLGVAIYPLIGGLVGSFAGWRSAFALAAGAAVLSGSVLIPALRRVPASRAQRAARGTTAAAQNEPQPRRGAPIVAFGVIYFGVIANMVNRHGFRNTVLPLFAASHLGLNAIEIAIGITVMSLTGVLVTIPGAALGDRIGRRRIVVAGLALMAVSGVVFVLVATDFVMFMLAAVLLGCGDFFASSQTALLSDLVEGPRRAMALGAYRFCVDLGALVGPVLLATLMSLHSVGLAIGAASGILATAALANRVGTPSRSAPP
ncbi:MAG: MFS transporter [Streptosporangiales bacterium]|nr:MFS transporter [Streptosporangiales bacterium]